MAPTFICNTSFLHPVIIILQLSRSVTEIGQPYLYSKQMYTKSVTHSNSHVVRNWRQYQ
jgi:hypothetical protein